mmetsp:Transcript_29480/g.42166  ORF Transcript_29480/g.42166 Transcript_29480/m.42166 type:complete len:82 (-) Transcript_29480:297-542(-)|eukprot:CAMPEP_0172416288 /NCGR_PEP_ID=MMETSP1064-20121228/2775_1 /TAXON_ID=202472 /ORGANISM="Aulacoseira subarctica , Strain CCAP 1002/5" /LENGTH=81 /DNA_ID=CAMNT_0013153835 /DNA_START=45 /DNA_END=290 /DNA_ORIENTATION=+
MKVLALAVISLAIYSAASGVHQKTTTFLEDHSSAIEKEWNIDFINKIQLEDQAFWDRSLSISMSHLGDESYACVPYPCGGN